MKQQNDFVLRGAKRGSLGWPGVILALLVAGLCVVPVAAQEQPPEFVLQWGTSGTAEGRFWFSWGLAVGPSERVYVVEAAGNRVQRFSGEGDFEALWGWGVATGEPQFETCDSGCLTGIGGDGAGQLLAARGVGVDSIGRVYVADEQNHRINIYNSNGSFLEAWGWGVATGASAFEVCTSSCLQGLPGGGDGQLAYPHSVEVDRSTDAVYVADAVNQRVQVFASDGSYLGMIGWGAAGIWFGNPTDVAVNSNGSVYVVDLSSHSVFKVAADGTLDTVWGGFGAGPGQFNEPHGIAIDSHDNVYVTERWNHRVQKFDEDGVYLSAWGTQGVDPGQFMICTEIAVDSRDDIYVSDHTDRIQKFSPTAETRTEDLIESVTDLDLPRGIESSLLVPLERVSESLNTPSHQSDLAVEREMRAFINRVEALSGRRIPAADADRLIQWAQAIIDSL